MEIKGNICDQIKKILLILQYYTVARIYYMKINSFFFIVKIPQIIKLAF